MKHLCFFVRAMFVPVCVSGLTGLAYGTGEAARLDSHEYAAVITGGELLRGVYADGHTQFLARTLRPLGLRCVASICVGDQAPDLQSALRFAADHAPLVIVTGGLGPTDDDITRETLAAFAGAPLQENPEVLARLVGRAGGAVEKLRSNLRRQALLPEGSNWLSNRHGTAVGIWLPAGEHLFVALPGPPRELQPMVREELLPRLRDRFGVRPLGISRRLRFAGIGESRIDQTLHAQGALPPDLEVSSIFEEGRVDLTLSLPGHRVADEARLDGVVNALQVALGDHVYATNASTLEDVVLAGLHAHGSRLAVAELGSGGALAVHLRRSAEARETLAGVWVLPGKAAFERLVGDVESASDGADFAAAAAQVAASRTKVEWGLASSVNEDGRIWVAFGRRDGPVSRRQFSLRDNSAANQGFFATAVLEWMRHLLAATDPRRMPSSLQPGRAGENSPPIHETGRARAKPPVPSGTAEGRAPSPVGLPSLTGLAPLGGFNPALKSWAILRRPSGTDATWRGADLSTVSSGAILGRPSGTDATVCPTRILHPHQP